jgi:hypothetical protein
MQTPERTLGETAAERYKNLTGLEYLPIQTDFWCLKSLTSHLWIQTGILEQIP